MSIKYSIGSGQYSIHYETKDGLRVQELLKVAAYLMCVYTSYRVTRLYETEFTHVMNAMQWFWFLNGIETFIFVRWVIIQMRPMKKML